MGVSGQVTTPGPVLRLLRPVTPTVTAENARQQRDLSRLLRCYTFFQIHIHTRSQGNMGLIVCVFIGGAIPGKRNKRQNRNKRSDTSGSQRYSTRNRRNTKPVKAGLTLT